MAIIQEQEEVDDGCDTKVVSLKREPRIGKRIGRFDILAGLGNGGCGRVYLAQDTDMQKYSLKVFKRKDESPHPLRAAYERVKELPSSNFVASVIETGSTTQEDGTRLDYAVSEYVPGTDLRRLTLCSGPVQFHEARYVLRDMARALSLFHDSGLLYRDMKPFNVIQDEGTGFCKLIDFDLVVEEHDKAVRTQDGSPAYTPREVFFWKEATRKTDIYGLGITVHEILLGHHPFGANTIHQIYQAVMKGTPPVKQGLCPPYFAELLGRMTSQNKDCRPETSEILEILDANH